MRLNELMLNEVGGRWDRPPTRPVTGTARLRDEAAELVAGFPPDRPWAVKDPRMLYTLDVWREIVEHPRLVGTVRHPAAVARSLHQRSGMPVEDGIALWVAYNRRLVSLCEQEDVPLLSFDDDSDTYLAAAGSLVRSLGLEVPSGGFEFFEGRLRNRVPETIATVPGDAMALYRELQALAGSGIFE